MPAWGPVGGVAGDMVEPWHHKRQRRGLAVSRETRGFTCQHHAPYQRDRSHAKVGAHSVTAWRRQSDVHGVQVGSTWMPQLYRRGRCDFKGSACCAMKDSKDCPLAASATLHERRGHRCALAWRCYKKLQGRHAGRHAKGLDVLGWHHLKPHLKQRQSCDEGWSYTLLTSAHAPFARCQSLACTCRHQAAQWPRYVACRWVGSPHLKGRTHGQGARWLSARVL